LYTQQVLTLDGGMAKVYIAFQLLVMGEGTTNETLSLQKLAPLRA
jgi:hypothetical protein